MSIQLTIMSLDFDSSGAPSTTVYYKDEITLGRAKHNDVVLERSEVSEVHARLRVDFHSDPSEPILYITDLGSSNGTLVENNSLKSEIEVRMLANERIIIGNYLIKPTILKDSRPESSFDELEVEVEEIDTSAIDIHVNGHGKELQESAVVSKQVVEDDQEFQEAEIEEIPEAFVVESTVSADSMDYAAPTSSLDALIGEVDRAAVEIRQEGSLPRDSDWGSFSNSETEISTPENSTDAGSFVVEITVKVDGSEIQDLNFFAKELFTLRGKVINRDEGLADVEVESNALGFTRSKSDGSFEFTEIPEGTKFELRAKREGFIFDVSTASGAFDSDIEVSIPATELLAVRGKVLHRGRGLQGVVVSGGELGETITNEQGQFSFFGVPEFTAYKLSLSKEKFLIEPSTLHGTLEHSQAEPGVVARELFSISGKVVHQGKPLVDVLVEAGELGSVRTDGEGVYRFENVPEGAEYTLKIRKEKFQIIRPS